MFDFLLIPPFHNEKSYSGLTLENGSLLGRSSLLVLLNAWSTFDDGLVLKDLTLRDWRWLISNKIKQPFAWRVIQNLLKTADSKAPLVAMLRESETFSAGQTVYVAFRSKIDDSDSSIIRGTISPDGEKCLARYQSGYDVIFDNPQPAFEGYGKSELHEDYPFERTSPCLLSEAEYTYLCEHEEFRPLFLLNAAPVDRRIFEIAFSKLDSSK